MRKIVSVLLAATMLISVLAGCGADSAKSTSNDTVNDTVDSAAANDTGAQNEDNGSKTESGELTEVTWVSASALASLDYCWIYVAQEMGYFEQEGLKVNIIEDTTSSDAKFVAAGSAEFSCTSPGVAVSTYDAGATNITAVCNQVILNHFGLAVNKDSGVKDWSDLEGCTIASVNDVWPALFNPILAAAGVDTNSVTYVSYGSAEYEALNTGVAQVMGSWLSEYYMCLGMGYDWDWLDGNSVLPQISNSIWVNNEFAEKNPDVVTGFVTAVQKAMYFCYLNPEAAADIVMTIYPEIEVTWEGAVGAVKGNVAAMFGLTEEERAAKVSEKSLGIFDMELVQQTIDNLYAGGSIQNEYKAEDMYTNEYVTNDWDYSAVEADASAYEFTSALHAGN